MLVELHHRNRVAKCNGAVDQLIQNQGVSKGKANCALFENGAENISGCGLGEFVNSRRPAIGTRGNPAARRKFHKASDLI